MTSEEVLRTLNARAARYPGEDTRLTSRKELAGWYSYGWAAEVFVVCGVGETFVPNHLSDGALTRVIIGSFIPITLEQLARENGVMLSDRSKPCSGSQEKVQCVVEVLGVEVNTASFAMYTFSISVLVQALVIISMSGAADHGRYRKKLLLVFAGVGAVATMLFLPVGPAVFVLGALLAIVANTSFGASFVLLNSFLPLLVRNHPSIQDSTLSSFDRENEIHQPDLQTPRLGDSTAALLPTSEATRDLKRQDSTSPELLLSTTISSYGYGIGYSAAVLVQIGAIVILLLTGSSTFSLRLIIFLIGVWWAAFTVPAALFLRPRPGPPLAASRTGSLVAYLTHSWALLVRTILQARRLRDITVFLLAWFLLSDAQATVSGTAILFAKTELGMPPAALAFISVISTLFGVLGAFAWSWLSRYAGWTPGRTLAGIIALFEIIPLYGLLGFVPAVRALGVFGLQQEWEMYVLGAVYGLVLGGIGAFCRALYGELIPPGSEAAFYALFAITDKGSSVFGPAIVGAITDAYGGIRPAFVFLAILVGLPLPLVLLVDLPRGREEGRRLVRLEGTVEPEPESGNSETPDPRGRRNRDYVALSGEDLPDEQDDHATRAFRAS